MPLVHCITNTVAANFAANAVIAVGGSPVMASEPTEVAQITKLAGALTINIGTCSPQLVVAIKNAVEVANHQGTPWVLDPVGVAATKTRQDICADLILNYQPSVIRGNASEIVALAVCTGSLNTSEATTRGLDSTMTTESAYPAALALAKTFETIVAVSGERDLVIDGKTSRKFRTTRTIRVCNGDPMMAQITASGCSLTAVLGCFIAGSKSDEDLFHHVVSGISYYAVAGELAAKKASGTGTMHSGLLDYLSSMTREEFLGHARSPIDLSVYLVTDPVLNRNRPVTSIVRASLEGGATVVQLREKECDSGEFLKRALEVKKVCDEFQVPLLINDRCDIALAVDAAGVHIGQDDLPVEYVRKLLGPTKIIGLSVSTPEEIEACKLISGKNIDYIGVGPVWPTGTKKNAKEALGVDSLSSKLANVEHLAVAIGGITLDNAQKVLDETKIHGIAVVTALTMAEDPKAAALKLKYRHK